MKNTSIYIIVLCLIWAGMLLGISFLEAPVKFTAPSLTLPIGLDVGRHVFQAFNKVEIVFGTLLFIFIVRSKLSPILNILFAFTIFLLILECVWLLPVLDERVLIIIAGGIPEKESPHIWYVLFDAAKVISLITIGVVNIKQLRKQVSDIK